MIGQLARFLRATPQLGKQNNVFIQQVVTVQAVIAVRPDPIQTNYTQLGQKKAGRSEGVFIVSVSVSQSVQYSALQHIDFIVQAHKLTHVHLLNRGWCFLC